MMRILALSLIFCVSFLSFAETKSSYIYIGDSHTAGLFGLKIDSLLRENKKITLFTNGSCGASTFSFLKPTKTTCGNFQKFPDEKTLYVGANKPFDIPSLSSLLDKYKPETVIVALGSNQILKPEDFDKDSIDVFLAKVKSVAKKCIWIGPPKVRMLDVPQLNEFYELISEITKKFSCTLVDSRPLATYPTVGGDGMHFDSLSEPQKTELINSWVNGVHTKIKPLIEN